MWEPHRAYGDLALFLGVIAAALALAEMSSRQEASTRWYACAILYVITMGMLFWYAYG
jgi:hypothetical protein